MGVSAMRIATVGVSDLDQAIVLFRDVMELQEERSGPVPASLTAAWKLPNGITAQMTELSCNGYPIGRLRLVEYTPTPSKHVRLDHGGDGGDKATDVGPKALDFYVADPILDSIKRIKKAGYSFRSPPVRHEIGVSISEECLFSGPDGLPVLIMVGHRHPETVMRPGTPHGLFSEIPTISVVSGSLEKTRQFYGGILGLTAKDDAETPNSYRNLVNDLTGVPRGTRVHFLLYGTEEEASGKILLVHFFDQTGARLKGRMRPGHLGFSLLTHDTKDLEGLHKTLIESGADIVSAPTIISDDGPKYLTMLVKGPNEEMFEFTQR